jgi:enamine deaminase RidA (YjgF/YER057c/UK114 family)
LGARLEDVVRTRVYVRDLADWEAVARAHGQRFAAVRPANTLVQAGLIGSEYRVEIEALWVVDHYRDRPAIAMNGLRQYLNYFFTAVAL